MKTHTAYFERFTLEITEEQAKQGSHQGTCDADIAKLLKDSSIKAQFETVGADSVRDELREYGAWDEEELQDNDANAARILWIACGDIVDELAQRATLGA